MDVAFSLIKRDYIFAANCNYDDTANLQTRCPFCYEPVFLKAGTTKKNHFAHYSESLNSADCELRAKSYYSSYSEFESETKGQTLLKHYRIFSNLYAVYMGVPKDIVLYTNLHINELILPTIDLINNGKSDLEIELQRDNMKDFLSLSLKILLNSIINQKLNIPVCNTFYEIYKESIKDFLDYSNNRILDYNSQGINLIKQKLAILQNEDKKILFHNQIINNRDYIINNLSKRFSVEEIHKIFVCLLSRECKEVNRSLKQLSQQITKKYTNYYISEDGKRRNCLDLSASKYLDKLDFHKISLFLGQENVFVYERIYEGINNIETNFILINDDFDFFGRLSKIGLFSSSENSDFFKYYKWGPIIKRHYKIFKWQKLKTLRPIYLQFYESESKYYENYLLKAEQKKKKKETEEEQRKIDEAKKNPTFIIHKKNELQQDKSPKIIVCKFCKKEIPTSKLIMHLKKEHPKTN